MQINLKEINPEEFRITEYKIAGEICYLINPQPSFFSWTLDNLHLRSSLWNSKGELISSSFSKFFNLEERPDIYPFNGSLEGCSLMEKIDGSTLIVSKYKGELILRTRGRLEARMMPNGKEIDIFLEKFIKSSLNEDLAETWSYSYIFEWVSPYNQIVIGYSEPEFYYTNCILHDWYLPMQQEVLDYDMDKSEALTGVRFKRPNRYKFNSIKELLSAVEVWEGKEGICLYYDRDQHIRKIKSVWYLKLHAFKSNCNIKTITELYFEWNRPSEEEFRKKLEQQFDHECLVAADPLIIMFYAEGVSILETLVQDVSNFVNESKELSQKEFALQLMDKYSTYAPLPHIAFSIRRGTENLKSFKTLLSLLLKQEI
jgi:hypothetical protein